MKDSIKTSTLDNNISPVIYYNDNTKSRVEFNKSCLKQDKAGFTSKAALDFYIVCNINS